MTNSFRGSVRVPVRQQHDHVSGGVAVFEEERMRPMSPSGIAGAAGKSRDKR